MRSTINVTAFQPAHFLCEGVIDQTKILINLTLHAEHDLRLPKSVSKDENN